jgi:hypothetical protein
VKDDLLRQSCTGLGFALWRVGRRWRHDEELREARRWPCPVRVRYDQAALAQYAMLWGLSTGIIRDVVRTHRRERSDYSTHGLPRSIAAQVILAKAPKIGTDKAREMVDAMLEWVICRHSRWFWDGLQGDRTIGGQKPSGPFT